MRDGYLRGTLPRTPTARQVDVLAAFVAAGGSVPEAAALVGVRPSTAKRHLADLRARCGLSTEQLIYRGRAEGWLVVSGLEPYGPVVPAPVDLSQHPGPASPHDRRQRTGATWVARPVRTARIPFIVDA